MPLLGIEIVPVTPVGAGLTPGDTISVEPRGMPVGETAEAVAIPSGEVAPTVGVGAAIPLTCATATLQTNSAGTIAATSGYPIGSFRFRVTFPRRTPIDFITISPRPNLSNIAQSVIGSTGFGTIGSDSPAPYLNSYASRRRMHDLRSCSIS